MFSLFLDIGPVWILSVTSVSEKHAGCILSVEMVRIVFGLYTKEIAQTQWKGKEVRVYSWA
jgi:hypothetical protein